MNFLAHLYLADPTPEAQLGNLLGDFVKGPLTDQYPPAILEGIALHRAIDRYTDQHPEVLRCKTLFSSRRRRYAGIILDLSFDHFLARQWPRYSTQPLEGFARDIYQLLECHYSALPFRLQAMLPRMTEQDWLTSYRELAAIGRALDNMSRRLRRENTLYNAREEIEAHYAVLEQAFERFFPDLIRFTRQQQALQRKSSPTVK